uniref:Programmed cell death protein 2 (Trinotate prediction) n=1 Tax=Henneguya salminicola TaxID=69463 RepID=A0A6G3MHG9_HENSL
MFIGELLKIESEEDFSPYFFPSKVGGTPVWLSYRNVPTAKQLICKACDRALLFLLQLYCSIDKEDCFHRTIYVFCCDNPECYQKNYRPFLILRTNLPRINKYYPFEPTSGDIESFALKRLEQQLLSKFSTPRHKYNRKFDEYCIIFDEIFPMQHISEQEQTENELKKLKELQNNNPLIFQNSSSDFDASLIKNIEQEQQTIEKDKQFKKFHAKIKDRPKQIIRYDRGGIPLYISKNNQPTDDDIPICPKCRQKFIFEFQILPQLIYFLKLKEIINAKSIDWGTIMIYTCPESCSPQGVGSYTEEFVWKQDI